MKQKKYKRSNKTHRKKRTSYGGEYEPGEDCIICMGERKNCDACVFDCTHIKHRFCPECTHSYVDTIANNDEYDRQIRRVQCPTCRANLNYTFYYNFVEEYLSENEEPHLVGIIDQHGHVNIGIRVYNSLRNLSEILLRLIVIGIPIIAMVYFLKMSISSMDESNRRSFQMDFILSYLNRTGQLETFDFTNFDRQDFLDQLDLHDNINTTFVYRPIGGTKKLWLLSFLEDETDFDTKKMNDSSMITCMIDTKIPMNPINKKMIKQALKIKQKPNIPRISKTKSITNKNRPFSLSRERNIV